ncbi:MAG: hypothetical protein ACFE96_19290 [Candidatus Hermodarchaeota archaeon]
MDYHLLFDKIEIIYANTESGSRKKKISVTIEPIYTDSNQVTQDPVVLSEEFEFSPHN